MTLAHAEQVVSAPMQQSVRSALMKKRLVVDLFIGFFVLAFCSITQPAFAQRYPTGLVMFSIIVIIESQRQ